MLRFSEQYAWVLLQKCGKVIWSLPASAVIRTRYGDRIFHIPRLLPVVPHLLHSGW